MNILVLTAYPPVLHMHGGGVLMYQNIRALAKRHRVRVISFVESQSETALLRQLEPMCESVMAVQRVPDFRPHWLSVKPFLVREFSTPEMYLAVDRVFRSSKVDVLHCEYLQMVQFRRGGVFTLLTLPEVCSANAHDEFRREQDPLQKARLFYRWMSMLRYEVQSSKKCDRVITMTEHDASYLRSYCNGSDIRAIPIGIDAAEFTPWPEEADRPLEVLFLGNFRHTPNLEAARFLTQQIAPRFPDLRFVLAGGNVPVDVNQAPNVRFSGYIGDTRVLYHRPNTVVATPLFSGTGQRVKLLEAFAMACPVITSSVGALGFPVRDGVEALIANNVEEFAGALERVLASQELRRRLGTNGREMIMRHFSWDHLGELLLELVEEAAPAR